MTCPAHCALFLDPLSREWGLCEMDAEVHSHSVSALGVMSHREDKACVGFERGKREDLSTWWYSWTGDMGPHCQRWNHELCRNGEVELDK